MKTLDEKAELEVREEIANIIEKGGLDYKGVTVDNFADLIDFSAFSNFDSGLSENLSENFIRKFFNKLNLENILTNQNLSISFIEEILEEIPNKGKGVDCLYFWTSISLFQKLTEEFICLHQNELQWEFISCSQNLSKDFVIEFKHKIDWECLSRNPHFASLLFSDFKNDVC